MTLSKEQLQQIQNLLRAAYEVEEILDNEVRPSKARAAKHEAARMLLKTKDTLQFILEQNECDNNKASSEATSTMGKTLC